MGFGIIVYKLNNNKKLIFKVWVFSAELLTEKVIIFGDGANSFDIG